jgi:hypothetical protein
MEPSYTIVSFDNTRLLYKSNIREALQDWKLINDIPFYSRYDLDDVERLREVEYSSGFYRSELAIWYGQRNCWKWAAANGPLLVLEDDAILDNNFKVKFDVMSKNFPDGWDYISLWVPEIAKRKVDQIATYENPFLAKIYQRYGGVATLYSQAGAQKLLDISEQRGIYTTWDTFLHFNALKGNLNGYCPSLKMPSLVTHSNNVRSLKVYEGV